MAALFACTKCNSRHPFEDLSSGQQLCKDCRGAFPFLKCTYCRSEFQDSSKGSPALVCKKCETNVMLYGKPSACEYCNIIAAFIGAKCQRCTNSEKRYGPPSWCEQCKQKCAFDRKDDSQKKVEGKMLCYLCTLSYRRALAKSKQVAKHMPRSKSSGHHGSSSSSSLNHKKSSSHFRSKNKEHSPNKKARLELSKSMNGNLPNSESTLVDSVPSDHVVQMHELKDKIASLEKQLTMKHQQMLAKEIQAAEQKAQQVVVERELKLKVQSMQKEHEDTVQDLQSKVRVLQKKVITLSNSLASATKGKKGKDTDSPQRL